MYCKTIATKVAMLILYTCLAQHLLLQVVISFNAALLITSKWLLFYYFTTRRDRVKYLTNFCSTEKIYKTLSSKN